MKIESLDELEKAFSEWRNSKSNSREPIPEFLLEQARQLSKDVGVTKVCKAAQLQHTRLTGKKHRSARNKKTGKHETVSSTPSFTKISLPSLGSQALAEVEFGGAKLRLFVVNAETLAIVPKLAEMRGDS